MRCQVAQACRGARGPGEEAARASEKVVSCVLGDSVLGPPSRPPQGAPAAQAGVGAAVLQGA